VRYLSNRQSVYVITHFNHFQEQNYRSFMYLALLEIYFIWKGYEIVCQIYYITCTILSLKFFAHHDLFIMFWFLNGNSVTFSLIHWLKEVVLSEILCLPCPFHHILIFKWKPSYLFFNSLIKGSCFVDWHWLKDVWCLMTGLSVNCRLWIEFRNWGKKLDLNLQMRLRFTLNLWMKINQSPSRSWIHR